MYMANKMLLGFITYISLYLYYFPFPFRRRQVHSSEVLVAHNPTCSLHMQQSNGTQLPPNYNTVIDLEALGSTTKLTATAEDETDSAKCVCKTPDKDRAVATDLLLDKIHKVEFGFPWERQRVVVEAVDSDEPASSPTATIPLTLLTPPQVEETPQVSPEPSRADCDGQSQEQNPSTSPVHVVLRRGINLGMGLVKNRSKETVVQIAMDDGEEDREEGMDEVRRRELTTEKWKQRKLQIDIELKRLRHNEERAWRFSGAFVHQALDPREMEQLQEHHRRTQSSRAGIHSSKARWRPSDQPKTRRKLNRSKSMQVGTSVGRSWSRLNDPLMPPRLEITEEVEEEEYEDDKEVEDAGLGLPPKDVPFYEDKALTNALDMSQIPVAEIDESIHSQHSDHSWNTAGEQDHTF